MRFTSNIYLILLLLCAAATLTGCATMGAAVQGMFSLFGQLISGVFSLISKILDVAASMPKPPVF